MNNEIKLIGQTEVEGITFTGVEGGFGEGKKSMLAKDVADIHNRPLKKINELINNNRNRFIDRKDIVDLLFSDNYKQFAKEKGLIGSNRTQNVYLLSERGYAKLCNLFKSDEFISNKILKHYFMSSIVAEPTNTKEYSFYEQLHEQLEVFNILDGKAQYTVKNEKGTNYRIDYYIPSLNIAIEYDENEHTNYTYEQHNGRQDYIESKLGCKFIRVSDKYSINIACAKVLKQLFA